MRRQWDPVEREYQGGACAIREYFTPRLRSEIDAIGTWSRYDGMEPSPWTNHLPRRAARWLIDLLGKKSNRRYTYPGRSEEPRQIPIKFALAA